MSFFSQINNCYILLICLRSTAAICFLFAALNTIIREANFQKIETMRSNVLNSTTNNTIHQYYFYHPQIWVIYHTPYTEFSTNYDVHYVEANVLQKSQVVRPKLLFLNFLYKRSPSRQFDTVKVLITRAQLE